MYLEHLVTREAQVFMPSHVCLGKKAQPIRAVAAKEPPMMVPINPAVDPGQIPVPPGELLGGGRLLS